MLRLALALLSALVVSVAALTGGQAENQTGAGQRGATRIALVIGNANYQVSPLPTSLNDAGLVAQTLAQAGFDVTAKADADGETTRKLFRDFQAKLQSAGPDAVAFVYLAGYGMQFDGENYVAPVDARIERDVDVPSAAVSLSELTQPIEATPARARIFVYDLARAGPFATAGPPLASGLGMPAARTGTLTAFNAAPGTVALPDSLPYGVYARSLAEMIQAPGLPIDALFQRVRLRVSERTNGAVLPFAAGTSDVVVSPGPSNRAALAEPAAGSSIADAFASCIRRDVLPAYVDFVRAYSNDPLAARVRRMIALRREALIWREAVLANTTRAYWTYMRRYPRGPHFGDVRRRLAALRDYLEPPPRFDIYAFQESPPAAEELAVIGKRDILEADPDRAVVPPVPEADLPPPRAAFFEGLPPPPIAPQGVVPMPVPVSLPSGAGEASRTHGRVVQPFVPGYGVVAAATDDRTVLVTSQDKPISRTVEATDHGTHALVQSATNGAVISRTVIVRETGTLAIVQRGPSGSVLTQTVTRTEPEGGTSTAAIDGQNRLIETERTSKSGIVTSITRGMVPVREQMFVLMPTNGTNAPPSVMSVAQLEANDRSGSSAQAAGARGARQATAPGVAASQVTPMPSQLPTSPNAAVAPVPAARPAASPAAVPSSRVQSDGGVSAVAPVMPKLFVSPTGGATLQTGSLTRPPGLSSADLPKPIEPPMIAGARPPPAGTAATPAGQPGSSVPSSANASNTTAPPTASSKPAAPKAAATSSDASSPASQAEHSGSEARTPASPPLQQSETRLAPAPKEPQPPQPSPGGATPTAPLPATPNTTSQQAAPSRAPVAPSVSPPTPAPSAKPNIPPGSATPAPLRKPEFPIASPVGSSGERSAEPPTQAPLPPPRPSASAEATPEPASGDLTSKSSVLPRAPPLPPRRPASEKAPNRSQPRESGGRHKTAAPARRGAAVTRR